MRLLAFVLLLAACGGGASDADATRPDGSPGVAVPATARPVPPDSSEAERDLLTLANGAVLVSASSNAADALALLDGDPGRGWHDDGPRDPFPHTFVFELRAPTRLTHVGVDNAIARPGGVANGAARTFRVEASAEGPEAGFAALGTLTVEPDETALLDVAAGAPVRWLRYTLLDSHGSTSWVYVDEVIAYGEQAPVPSDGRFSGVFDGGRGATVTLHQDGATLTGCYVDNGGFEGGTLLGSVDGGVARLAWDDHGSDVRGTALFVIDSRGHLNGVRFNGGSRTRWGGAPAPEGTTTPCSETQAPANPVADALESAGEVTLYGILFDFDEATLRPESESVLRQLRDALAGSPGTRVTIEGHTDAVGADAYNRDLSQRRAESVVAWLAANGIERARLTPVGKGEAEPVADNATADGRALNRRVEVRRE